MKRDYTIDLRTITSHGYYFLGAFDTLSDAQARMRELVDEYWTREADRDDDGWRDHAMKMVDLASEDGDTVETDLVDGWSIRLGIGKLVPEEIGKDDLGRYEVTLTDGTTVRVDSRIIASDGREGVITEIRPDAVHEDDASKVTVFARPKDRMYTEEFRDGKLIMATAWTVGDDGLLHGIWADGRLGEILTAEVK